VTQRYSGEKIESSGTAWWTALALSLWSAAAVWFFHFRGWLLYYGDAEAHLNIARGILDSQTPGYSQIGGVWLPLPHLAMALLVRYDSLWISGIGGAIPSAACFVTAGMFLFAAVRRIFGSTPAAVAATAVFALNPNMMYLQSTAMTEAYFAASLCATLYFTARFRETQGWGSVVGAGLAACAGTLARYDGWFLLPFLAAYFFFAAKKHRVAVALAFSALAGAGPLYWLAHNWYMAGDPLSFWRGEYSAAAIQGNRYYPGKGNWYLAVLYYGSAVRHCAGPVAAVMALAGILAALAKRAFWPIFLLALPAMFYVWSLHSSGTPIFVPDLWPHSYYNTRYGLATWPLIAFAVGALAAAPPRGVHGVAACLVIAAGVSWWVIHPSHENWVTWAESRANSEGRRAWTREAAAYLGPRYLRGSGIISSSGTDFFGIYREMRLPLREIFSVCNGLSWDATLLRPELYLWHEWAVVKRGDSVQVAIVAAARRGIRYHLDLVIEKKDEPVVEIYRRMENSPPGAQPEEAPK
jgi:hypothetical protein